MKIGDFLKSLRISKKLRQEDLSSLAIVNASKISRMEKYNQMIGFDEACRIFNTLNIAPNDLWENIKNEYKGLAPPQEGRVGEASE